MEKMKRIEGELEEFVGNIDRSMRQKVHIRYNEAINDIEDISCPNIL